MCRVVSYHYLYYTVSSSNLTVKYRASPLGDSSISSESVKGEVAKCQDVFEIWEMIKFPVK